MPLAPLQQNIDRAIRKLESFCDSGLGIVEAVACGHAAVPALRSLLNRREPSGLSHARCRAVDALAALKSHDVLIDYLNAEHAAVDPVERLGDDAVLNYAAWAVARTREERVFELLLRLAQRPSLSGVIGALGTFGRSEAIPVLVDALEEDGSRTTAEFMLRRVGRDAVDLLLRSAKQKRPSAECESESSLRRRRSSLLTLANIGLSEKASFRVKELMKDADTKIAVVACKIWLLYAPEEQRVYAIDRLMALLPSADWMLRGEIEDCLGIVRPRVTQPSFAPKSVY